MNEKIVLDDNDVVSIGSCVQSFGLASTFKSLELINAARNWVTEKLNTPISHSVWFTKDGIRCQVLSADGNGWKPGKVRLSIEFIPDKQDVKPVDSVSPLEDLRSELNI